MTCLFEMELENLYIVGEPEGATKFSLSLNPGDNTVKMLKPVKEGLTTGIQMRYDFKLDDM